MYYDLWSQYIKVLKLFKGGNYSRAETIHGNMVFTKIRFSLGLSKHSHFISMYVLRIRETYNGVI